MDWVKVLVACIAFGAGAEAFRQYRMFKASRRQLPYEARNRGPLTDKRLYQAELVAFALLYAIPHTGIVLFVSADRPIWVLYALIAVFPLIVIAMVAGINRPYHQ